VLTVLPAHAGMARHRNPRPSSRHAFSPHTRGWPGPRRSLGCAGPGSPRTRGDGPAFSTAAHIAAAVLPAHAGMARMRSSTTPTPRAFSPHTRGWPVNAIPVHCRSDVLPAHAGMARSLVCSRAETTYVLPAHAGMARHAGVGWMSEQAFSPHTRGWPAPLAGKEYGRRVLPAHAGMARQVPGCR